jgi:hypothetical protein
VSDRSAARTAIGTDLDTRAPFVAAARLALLLALACLACVLGDDGLGAGMSVPAVAGDPSPIGLGASGAFVVGGRPRFLIALSNPPPLFGRTPAGVPGPVEVVRTGVNLVRVGPRWTGWTGRELEHVLAWDRAAELSVWTRG